MQRFKLNVLNNGDYQLETIRNIPPVPYMTVDGNSVTSPGIAKGEKSGPITLSTKDDISDRQLVSLLHMTSDDYNAPFMWLDEKSSLKGDFELPIDSILINSNISGDITIIDSLIKDSNIEITNSDANKVCKALCVDSSLDNVIVSVNNEDNQLNLQTDPIFYIGESQLRNVDIMYENNLQVMGVRDKSYINNVNMSGYVDVDSSILESKDDSYKHNFSNVKLTGASLQTENTILTLDSIEASNTSLEPVENTLDIPRTTLPEDTLSY